MITEVKQPFIKKMATRKPLITPVKEPLPIPTREEIAKAMTPVPIIKKPEVIATPTGLEKLVGQNIKFQEKSELAQTFDHLDTDDIGEDGMSPMDMNSRLSAGKVSAILKFDSLVRLGIMPPELGSLTRQLKRLSVSLLGEGRKEKVRIAEADRDAKFGGKNMGGLASMFSRKP